MEALKLKENKLGERLKELREERKLIQREVSDKLGLTTYQLSRYESGASNPSPEQINIFADFYNVTADFLLGRSNIKDYTQKEYEDFLLFKDDPELQRWFYELPKSKEEDLRKLKKMWDIIKNDD